ncbi:MAG TPA: TetR/AcrR family transcriptional regulator [Streptosporangiaceae bacterium]|nr:TetR/AcrR family transcriptional regulator [Streptosporangiaceae bacterium]
MTSIVEPQSAVVIGTQTASARRRRRNARGQGARLADDILSGAVALIERTGSDESVTLRAVAREIGIAAPSIYAHFADRDAIILAVVGRVFDELTEAIEHGTAAAGNDPVDRLIAGTEAYVAYGMEHPARYGVLFSERRAAANVYCEPDETGPILIGPGDRPLLRVGAEAFSLLMTGIEGCVQAGLSASTDVRASATALWVALHGLVSLRTTLPAFPWPEPTHLTRDVVLSLAKITR